MAIIQNIDMNPLISIITPAYNSDKYIEDTIDSVLNQTYNNWELIIVDDFSNDNTLKIIYEYTRKDSRIILIKNDKNYGQSRSRNFAINIAKGRFIAFLDSDDIWFPMKLEKQVDFLLTNSKAFVFSYYMLINEDGERLNRQIKAPLAVSYEDLLHSNFIGCLTVMYDTFLIGKENIPNVKKRDDWACWLNILKKGYTAYCIPEPLAFYRLRNSSLSSNKFNVLQYNWEILRKEQKLSVFKSTYYLANYVLIGFSKILYINFIGRGAW